MAEGNLAGVVHGIVTTRVISLLFFGSLDWREGSSGKIETCLRRFLFKTYLFYKCPSLLTILLLFFFLLFS